MSTLTNTIFTWLQTLFDSILSTLNLVNKEGTILFLGLDNAGKTTLLHKIRTGQITQQFPPTDRPTCYDTPFRISGVNFIGWDLGGHEAVRHLWEDYIPEGNAILFLIDASDENRLEEVKMELQALVSDLCSQNNNSNTKMPLAILLNKCDLMEALPSQLIADGIEYEELLKRYEREDLVSIFRCSVLRGEGYKEALQWVASFM